MEPPKPTKKKAQHSLHDVFAAKEKPLPDYIHQLAEWQVLTYYDEVQLAKYLKKYGGEGGVQFYQEFLRQKQFFKKMNKKQEIDAITRFPIVYNSDQIYVSRILEQFFIENEGQRQMSEFDSELDNPSNYQEEQEDIEKPQCQPELQKVEQQEQQKLQQSMMENAIEPKPKPKAQQTIYRLPPFLRQKLKSPSTWLAIDVTQEFSQELNEVKQVFRRQLNENGWVMNVYQTFLIDFIVYRSIIQGQYEKDLNEQQTSEILTELKRLIQLIGSNNPFDFKECHFLEEVLGILLRNIEKQEKTKFKGIKDSIQRICNEALDNVYLTCNYTPKSYGNTLSGIILINVNQVTKDVNLQMLRKGPLRPYIAICLYHQIAHYLVRQYHQPKLNEANSSFSTDKDSIGKNFIEVIKALSTRTATRQEAYIFDPKPDKGQCQKIFDRGLSKLQEIFKEYKQYIQKLQNIEENIKSIKDSLLMFFFPYRFGLQSKGYDFAGKWGLIYNYVDFLSLKKQSEAMIQKDKEILQKEEKYRLFFSLLLTDNIVERWLLTSNQPSKKWNPYKQKLARFKQSHQYTPQYYAQEVDYIDKLVEDTIGAVYASMKSKNSRQKNSIFDYSGQKQSGVIQSYIDSVLINNRYGKTNNEIASLIKDLPERKQYNNVKTELERCLNKILIIKMVIKEHIDLQALQNLRLESLKQEENNEIFEAIFQASEAVRHANQIINYAPLWKMMIQLPNFFSIMNESRSFQSGYEIEKRLFGRGDIDIIYTKDYQLMKSMDNPENRAQIGVQPKEKTEKVERIIVAKEGRIRQQKVDIKQNGCEVHNRNQQYARIRALKKLREAKKIKSPQNA